MGNSKSKKNNIKSPSTIVKQIKADPKVGRILRDIPILSNLTIKALNKLGGALIEKYKKSSNIFKLGDKGNGFYIIKSGSVSVIIDKNVEIAKLSTGDYFGETALLNDNPRGATVKTLEKTICYFLPKDKFTALFGKKGKLNKVNFAKRRIAVSAEGTDDQNKRQNYLKDQLMLLLLKH